MRPNWKPGTKIVCVSKFTKSQLGTPIIDGINAPRVGEIVTVHSPCCQDNECFDISEYLVDSISGTLTSFAYYKFRKLIEIDSEVSEASSELTVQERLDTVSQPLITNP